MHLPLTSRKTTEETTEEQMTNDIKDAIFVMMGYDQIFISSARISIWKASLVLDVGHQKVERVVLRVWPLDGSGVGAECR